MSFTTTHYISKWSSKARPTKLLPSRTYKCCNCDGIRMLPKILLKSSKWRPKWFSNNSGKQSYTASSLVRALWSLAMAPQTCAACSICFSDVPFAGVALSEICGAWLWDLCAACSICFSDVPIPYACRRDITRHRIGLLNALQTNGCGQWHVNITVR